MNRGAALLGLILAIGGTARAEGPQELVDPFIGTDAHGHTYPGATAPFGMVQLSPDTRLEGWDGCSGYHYSDDVIYGFSHTHLSGTGISDYGDVLLMPMTGPPLLTNGYGEDPAAGYASRFDKASERAGAGWYAVHLEDYNIDVELTATERTGFHRYRFPPGAPAHVVVDLAHRDEVLDASLRLAGSSEIEGHRRSRLWAQDQVVYFVARFSRPMDDVILALEGRRESGVREVEGRDVRGILSFGDGGGELRVKVGISAVDIAGARRNLDLEQQGWDFDLARREAIDRWVRALGSIELTGGTREQQSVFYTALYHSLLAPNVYSDVDGRYRGMDRKVHHAPNRRHYTVFSLWDTFRATHPLLTVLESRRANEFVRTFLAMQREGGRLPVWELAGNETDTMIGYHAIPVIADAWAKGIRDYDGQAALDAMLDSAERDHFGLAAYRRQGFIGAEDEPESVSKTLEYAFDDWCIARMADDLGREDVRDEYDRRSQGWRHLLDPQTGFMRARTNQRWVEPFDPAQVDLNYTEANAWQYSFFVPHDVEGLALQLGGDEAFVKRLDALFQADSRTTGRDQPDITGLIGQYAHGNEPSHHAAWLYHYAGQPARSADRVREILDNLYSTRPDGLCGNDDCGQLSSWYVLAASGLYPVRACAPEYLLVPPLFDQVVLRANTPNPFRIETRRASPDARYITEARLNGKPLTRSYLSHQEVVAGGTLRLTLGPQPGLDWGVALADRPPSRNAGEPVLAAPFARANSDVFRDRLSLELVTAEPGAVVRYTLSPDEAETTWQTSDGSLELTESTTLRFVAERDGQRSPVVQSDFHKLPNDWSIRLDAPPHSPYTASGPQTLIDGLRGSSDWRIGGWLGYQGADFVGTIDLGAVQPVQRISVSLLQDVRSWIWIPSEVAVAVSTDGAGFQPVAAWMSDVADNAEGVVLHEVGLSLERVEARFIRVVARSYGTIPGWHPGRGEPSWIFIDEITVE